MRSSIVAIALALCAAFSGSASARTYRITYLTSATAYIDAGQDDGVAVGGRIDVVRGGAVIATLTVTDVSSRRASCAIESASAALAVGDEVRFVPAPRAADAPPVGSPLAPAPAVAVEEADAKPRPSWASSRGLKGRIGVQYLGVFDQSGYGGDISRPSLDVRIDGRRVAGSAFDVEVDARARHTYQVVADGSEYDEAEARVYRLNASWRSSGDRVRVALGRQFSSALATISTFDGVVAEANGARFGGGVFAGTQPAPIDYGWSPDVQEYGAFVRVRSAARASLRWEGVLAGVGSYQDGQINREYVPVLGRLISRTLSLTLLQEIDVYRGWRESVEGDQYGFTSTFASARWRASKTVDLDAGYDNRRDVRLYEDYLSPETAFDAAYREGVWGGASVNLAGRYRFGAVVRNNSGGSAGGATSYTLTASGSRLGPANLNLRLRGTRYDNERSDGWMLTTAVGWAPDARWSLEFFGGFRGDYGKSIATPDVTTSWFGGEVDVSLVQGWYLNVSGENSSSGEDAYNQVYTGLSWRF
jgi:hypothetical protein